MNNATRSFCLLLLLIGSHHLALKATAQSTHHDNFVPVIVNGKLNQNLKGYWKSIGNGYIIDASSDSLLLYSYTTNFCYKEKNDYIEALLNSQARFTRLGDTISILLTDYGERSADLQITNQYIRINQLPQNHISFDAMRHLGPPVLFELFIETLKESYAFTIERKINWEAIRHEYRQTITAETTNEELFKIFGNIVMQTKDHHTKIISKSGETIQYRGTISGNLVTETFKKQEKIKNQNEYFNLFFATNAKNISDSLLHGRATKQANGKIEWGSLTTRTGYISINAFTDFAPKGFTRKQQIDTIYATMDHITNALRDKDAIIIDISFNFGGYDAAFLAIAGFFTNEPLLAYTSEVYNNGKFYKESNVFIKPSGTKQFSKPVYVLMTDISRSAAEGFVMAMKVLPNVRLVGTNSMGILSSMLGKSIGDFYLTLSNQRLVTPDNKWYEVSGINPDIELQVFNKEDIFESHKAAVRRLLKMIEK